MPKFDSDTSYFSIVIESIISAITLIIALAWNKAIKELIGEIKYLNTYGSLIYAILITAIGVSAIRMVLSFNKFGKFK